MDIQIDPDGSLDLGSPDPHLRFSLIFSTDPRALQSISNFRIADLVIAGASIDAVGIGSALVRPHRKPDERIKLPMQLRPEEPDGHNIVDLSLPIAPEVTEEATSGTLTFELEITFRRNVRIQLKASGLFNRSTGAISGLVVKRHRARRIVLVNLLFFACIVAITTWWNTKQNGDAGPLPGHLSSESVNSIVLVLSGFLGFPILRFVTTTMSDLSRMSGVWRYPELYLDRDVVRVFRAPVLTAALVVAAAVCGVFINYHASVPFDADVATSLDWRYGALQIDASHRFFVDEIDGLRAYCKVEQPWRQRRDPAFPIAKATLLPPSLSGSHHLVEPWVARFFGSVHADWATARVSIPRSLLPPDYRCARETADKPGRILVEAELDPEVSDACFAPIREDLLAFLCGTEPPEKSILTLKRRGDGAIQVSSQRVHDADSFRSLFNDFRMRLEGYGTRTEILRDQNQLIEEALDRPSFDGRQVPVEAFLAIHEESLDGFYRREPNSAVRSMTYLAAALKAYAANPLPAPDGNFMEKLSDQFAHVSGQLRQEGETPDKSMVRAHLRLMLMVERRWGGLSESAPVHETIDVAFNQSGLEWYVMLIQECIRADAVAIDSPDSTSTCELHHDLLIRGFRSVRSATAATGGLADVEARLSADSPSRALVAELRAVLPSSGAESDRPGERTKISSGRSSTRVR